MKILKGAEQESLYVRILLRREHLRCRGMNVTYLCFLTEESVWNEPLCSDILESVTSYMLFTNKDVCKHKVQSYHMN